MGKSKVEDEALTEQQNAAPAEPITVPAGTLEERVAWVAEGETSEERGVRAQAVWDHELDSDPDGNHDELSGQLTAAVHGANAPVEGDGAAPVEPPKEGDEPPAGDPADDDQDPEAGAPAEDEADEEVADSPSATADLGLHSALKGPTSADLNPAFR